MADHRHQADPILANYHAPRRLHGQVQHVPHMVGDDQRGGYWEGVPQPAGNEVMQGGYPRQMDAPNYNAVHYPPPPPPYPQVPHMHMYYPFAPEVQDNHDGLYGYGVHLPAGDPPGAFPALQPPAALPADMPPANGLRNLVGRFLDNPNTLINMLRIEPGPGGRFVVWVALELADI